jgi:hypothetical protein
MKMLTGAVLLVGAEQAFAHAHLIGFPHASFAREVLLPASYVLLGLGVVFLLWGVFTERRSSSSAT